MRESATAYQLLDQIGTTSGSRLYRARSREGAVAVLKLPGSDNAVGASALRREYETLHALDIPGVVKPAALTEHAGRLMMVLPEARGESLEALLARGRLDLPTGLRLAIQLAGILEGLHAAHLIHQDLRPANLLALVAEDAQLSLVDLSRATSDTQQKNSAADAAARDWPYLSPEQTGRMNRPIDYRTDFYSLGVVLYRMLTGQLPFEAHDALEWAHCHIARLPRSPGDVDHDIPPAVSDIVMKLLAKLPEDRYQSAHGVKFDLQHCLAQWQRSGRIERFALGTRDIPDRFQIPRKLYGRDAERTRLLEAFAKMSASGRTAFVAVSGPAGVGKSTLVYELHKPLAQSGGYFVTGKFDQHQRDIPYAAIAQAFRLLVQQLLSESEARIRVWRERILAALGSNGQLVVELLPQLELIIDRQPSVPTLAPAEARSRFHLFFRRFVGAFARPERPLVVFLDDLQWADTESLTLIGELLSHPEMGQLMLVGALRDGEADEADEPRAPHPLSVMLDKARDLGSRVDEIALGPLSMGSITQLIADTLHCTPISATPLAALIHEKTGGNPFFATQFLATLHDQRLIVFDVPGGGWRWNTERIRSQNVTDNVVDLMLGKLARLPARTQEALRQLACLGNAAELVLLAAVRGETEEAIEENLREAVRAGLAMRVDTGYAFTHDRVQEAAYALIPQASRPAMHLRIARLLQTRLARDAAPEQIFDLANQFNRALPSMTEPAERVELFRLNVLAGRKARAATAYDAARGYFSQASALLPNDSWRERYDDSFALHLSLAEAEYLVGDFDRADRLIVLLLEHAHSRLDRARVYQVRMALTRVAGRYAETVQAALDASAALGVAMPEDAAAAEAAEAESREIREQLAGRRIADIAEGPVLEDPELGILITLLTEASIATFKARPALMRLFFLKPVNLSLHHGNCPASAYAYSQYAARILSETSDVQSAVEFARMAIRLNEKFDDRSLKGRILASYAAHIMPWRAPIAHVLALLEEAYQACLEVGDVWFAALLGHQIGWFCFEKGDPLDEVLKGFDKHMAFAEQIGNRASRASLWLQRRFVQHLTDAADAAFDIAHFDADLVARSRGAWGPGFSHYELLKLMADFMDGRCREALAAAQPVAEIDRIIRNTPFEPPYLLFHSLTLAALHAQLPPDERRECLDALRKLTARLEFRAVQCPQNWQSQYALAAAEAARIEGRELDAERLYERAIRAAADNGLVHHQALAYEHAAAFHHARGFEAIAELYLREARACYLRWGAERKLRRLDELHPGLAPTAVVSAPVANASGELDLISVAKASQAISGRIVLDELVDTLLRLLIENAGAQSGALVLIRDDELVLAAEASSERQALQVRQEQAGKISPTALPAAILNYVRRSREQVLLADATQAHPFAGDPYFSRRQPRSVLCLPILRQASLVGMLYLENKLLTHAFTPERLTVLELLSAQAAISLENAQLYADLQRENRERRRAEEMLREREARIRRLVESNIIGVFFWGTTGEIYEANDAFLRIIGETRDQLKSGAIRWQSIFAPAAELDARVTAEINHAGRVVPYERDLLHADGRRVPVLTGAAYFEGTREQGVSFVLDLSEQKRVEEALRRAHEELETRVAERTRELTQSNERLGREIAERQHAESVLAERSAALARSNAELEQFAYVASHDLQEPLRMVGSYMQLLKKRYEDKLDRDAQEFIEYAVDGAKRMQGLIDDLLSYSRVGTKAKPFEPVELSAVLERALASLKAAIAESGAEIRVGPLPRVLGDGGQLAQLFQNLVGNAIKFRRSEVAPRVEVESEAVEAGWRISVRDNGIGVAPEYFERIFVMFQRLHTRREYPGTGIGLAICKKIVERHGGHIWIESAPEGGSIFRFTLPRGT